MNKRKVKELRTAYKKTLLPPREEMELEASLNGTAIYKQAKFQKNEFRQIKKNASKKPLEKSEKNKAKSTYKRVA